MPDGVPEATRQIGRRSRWTAGLLDDSLYSADELEFLRAIQKFKEEKRRPFPLWSEVYAVLLSLGYRKVDSP